MWLVLPSSAVSLRQSLGHWVLVVSLMCTDAGDTLSYGGSLEEHGTLAAASQVQTFSSHINFQFCKLQPMGLCPQDTVFIPYWGKPSFSLMAQVF